MAAPMEVILSSESSGQLWNTCVWDLHSGATLMHYKNGTTGPRSLCLLGDEYLMGAITNKPIIQIWALQRRDQIQQRIVCPGKVSCLAASPDGAYVAAGIGEKIHVWQVATGNLLVVLSRHYQDVCCVKFTDDGGYLVSAGEDSLVLVWAIASLLQDTDSPSRLAEPVYSWSAHSLPVTDIHVGCGGHRARVATASTDCTCKLWDLTSGDLLCNFVFETSITSVTMDAAECRLFAGASNGKIYQANLFEKPVGRDRHMTESSQSESLVFQGHGKQVTCMSISFDGSLLISGSHDSLVKVWDIVSRQCIRTINHKGAISNIIVTPTPSNMLNPQAKPTTQILPFKRSLHSQGGEDGDTGEVLIRLKQCRNVKLSTEDENSEILQLLNKKRHIQDEDEEENDDVQLKEKVARLRQANKELYQFAVNEIVNESHDTVK